MSAKNNKVDQPDENLNTNLAVDKSKRSFAKMGAVAPVIMTLASKTALGSSYECTVSGIQSGNHSGAHKTWGTCAYGISPGGWKKNCDGNGLDGTLAQWLAAKVIPFLITQYQSKYCYIKLGTKIQNTIIFNTIKNSSTPPNSKATATLFSAIFNSPFAKFFRSS